MILIFWDLNENIKRWFVFELIVERSWFHEDFKEFDDHCENEIIVADIFLDPWVYYEASNIKHILISVVIIDREYVVHGYYFCKNERKVLNYRFFIGES